MNDILVTALAWRALIGGIGGIVSGIYGLIITKRENENRLKINEFTNVTWKDGDELKCENHLEPEPMKPMTCKNCGAPLKGCECEYCGTRYYIPNNDTLAQLKQERSQALFDVANRAELNEIQNMVNQLRMLGENGSIEYMLNSGAISVAMAREMYMTKLSVKGLKQ